MGASGMAWSALYPTPTPEYKIPSPEPYACWYKIRKIPEWVYKDGKMQVKFTKLENVDINLYKGETIYNMELLQPDVAV